MIHSLDEHGVNGNDQRTDSIFFSKASDKLKAMMKKVDMFASTRGSVRQVTQCPQT